MKKLCPISKKISLKFLKKFNYEFKKDSRRDLYYFKSKKVYDYLNEIFTFETYWKPINSIEERQLLVNLNDVWI